MENGSGNCFSQTTISEKSAAVLKILEVKVASEEIADEIVKIISGVSTETKKAFGGDNGKN